MINLRNVSLEHRTESEAVAALQDVTLSVAAGEFLALTGASGSGKTSLINVISGLIKADSGEVVVAGCDLSQAPERQRSEFRLKNIGVVFQDHNLIPEFTAAENIMLPIQALGASAAEARTASKELLVRVGIGELADRYPKELSGGQKQRVGIARALSGDKKIILADEPTGALDHENSVAVFKLLQDLSASGLCVIVATHDTSISEFCSRLITIRDGYILEDSAAR